MAHGKSLELAQVQPIPKLLTWTGKGQQPPIRSRKRDFKRWLQSRGEDKHVIRKAMKQWEEDHESR